MSDSLSADVISELAESDRTAYLEQRIFVLSPFNLPLTAALIFAVFTATYALAVAFDHVAIWDAGAHSLSSASRTAFALSLLMTVVLAIQRYVRVRERQEVFALARVLKGGIALAKEMTKVTPRTAQLWLATALGAIAGIVADYIFFFSSTAPPGLATAPATRVWFSAITLVLVMSFARGVELTRTGARDHAKIIENSLIIDLLRIDTLSVWGRGAARFALIWFTTCAAACLLFVGSGITALTIFLLVACAAMGLWVFMAMMYGIHRRIRAEKRNELERLRGEIDKTRHQLGASADAAARIQGLLAYERRIEEVAEWPFDQTTLVRVGASALVLGVPWFGQAAAQYVVEHFAG
jgi:hypothetical protein